METIEKERITPTKARKMLEGNTANRPLRRWWVEELARAIREGRWRVTHQGIALNCDNSLIDGQHRLHAIILADKAVSMYVARGVDRDTGYAIDQGVTRTLLDIAGSPVGLNEKLTRSEVATARAMKRGDSGFRRLSRSDISNEEMLSYVLMHRDAIDWAIAHLSCKELGLAPILAAIARAYYHVDLDRLAEFCRVMSTGVATVPGDNAAVLLARVAYRDRLLHHSIQGTVILFRKTEAAIRAFLDRRSLTKICEVESEIFPLSDDD